MYMLFKGTFRELSKSVQVRIPKNRFKTGKTFDLGIDSKILTPKSLTPETAVQESSWRLLVPLRPSSFLSRHCTQSTPSSRQHCIATSVQVMTSATPLCPIKYFSKVLYRIDFRSVPKRLDTFSILETVQPNSFPKTHIAIRFSQFWSSVPSFVFAMLLKWSSIILLSLGLLHFTQFVGHFLSMSKLG